MTNEIVSEEIQDPERTASTSVPKIDYLKAHTYEQMSNEFKQVFPLALRAFELIPLMYNRLTLVDKLTHMEAFTRIVNDHRHLSGFTERNIRRYLPDDNPNIPHRVRTPRPKSDSNQDSDREPRENSNQDWSLTNVREIQKFLIHEIDSGIESRESCLGVWHEYQSFRKECSDASFPTLDRMIRLIKMYGEEEFCTGHEQGWGDGFAKAESQKAPVSK